MGFVTPNDSHTCYSPWSVFQDGSGGKSTTTPQTIGPGKCHTRNRLPSIVRPSPGLQNKQHDNQTQPSQQTRHARSHHKPPSPTHHTEPLQSADYTRETSPKASLTGYLPSRSSKATRTKQNRFNHNSQAAVPVVVNTRRKCTGE